MKTMQFRIKAVVSFLLCIGVLGSVTFRTADAAEPATSGAANAANLYEQRKELLERAAIVTNIPWYELAAIDQYERAMAMVRKLPTKEGRLIAVHFSPETWAGLFNPNHDDRNPQSIAIFKGVGTDGDNDGVADPNNDYDVLAAIGRIALKEGPTEDARRIALWNYYQNGRSVARINEFAKVYRTFNTLALDERSFVMPLGANYTYRSTWGASRGWGGARIHEGTDLFAGYGVPVRSACYGIVEVKGWNPYGGWRIGIRDLNNVYFYYAHLSGFQKELKTGDVVKPGQVLGWVGSSGYGKPGTSGKFPPHLHFGLYRDSGLSDWSFDPYPYLRKWEREELLRTKTKRS